MVVADIPVTPETLPVAAPAQEAEVEPKRLLIICYSGELEKTWAAMILATTGAAMGAKVRVFLTFWGLQTFVKDERRITGENGMQKMMSAMQRPGSATGSCSKMNFLGMGPWMMRKLAKQYNVASPKELLEMATGDGRGVHALPDDHGHVRPQARGHDRRAWASRSVPPRYIGLLHRGRRSAVHLTQSRAAATRGLGLVLPPPHARRDDRHQQRVRRLLHRHAGRGRSRTRTVGPNPDRFGPYNLPVTIPVVRARR